jgi:hypothetical protein
VVVRRGRYLNEAFKKGNDAGSIVLVVANIDQGFPLIPCPHPTPTRLPILMIRRARLP